MLQQAHDPTVGSAASIDPRSQLVPLVAARIEHTMPCPKWNCSAIVPSGCLDLCRHRKQSRILDETGGITLAITKATRGSSISRMLTSQKRHRLRTEPRKGREQHSCGALTERTIRPSKLQPIYSSTSLTQAQVDMMRPDPTLNCSQNLNTSPPSPHQTTHQ
ncbi:hypothetical protein BJX63DRAFT_416578 [Aspergillus granulosus]|uniref:Uncharacterized protein n=1 Tax=Aspergillus granulosus TaxID=176169 RepID=A0ABR4GS09_9EURO